MRAICRFVAILASTGVIFGNAYAADAVRGKALYENHCIGCHTDSVHKREKLKATNRAEVEKFVERWQKEMQLKWSNEDRADVTEYVATKYYKF